MNESFKVACNCKKETIVLRTNGNSKFTANSIGWKYRTSLEANAYESAHNIYISAGWYCGQENHYQESSHELS